MRALILVASAVLLTGCATAQFTVRDTCEQPPVPPDLLEPCEEPAALTSGTFANVYQQMLADLGPWGRCIRKDDTLVAVVKYRESAREQCIERVKKEAEKPWWKFWGANDADRTTRDSQQQSGQHGAGGLAG